MSTYLCITCDFKGSAFLEECKAADNTVFLLTAENLKDDPWPWHAIDDVFYMPEKDGRLWKLEDMIAGVAFLMRTHKIDRFISLDDYDVRKVASIREEFRSPGMGQTTSRHFYDKLAMRIQAKEAGLRVPAFSALFHDPDIHLFLDTTEAPWLVKPRSDAGAIGIKKIYTKEEFWQLSDMLGEKRHQYLIEEFRNGDICHVDALSLDREVIFSRSSEYLTPPFAVAHGGGIFCSKTLPVDDPVSRRLEKFNHRVMQAFGMRDGASHSEFILGSDDNLYFLETSARVGGAHLSELVEAASGINLWKEWARIEDAVLKGHPYSLPEQRYAFAGIIQSLSKYPNPDYNTFHDPEICWTLHKDHHIGFIFRSQDQERIQQLLDAYAQTIREDYHAVLPAKD